MAWERVLASERIPAREGALAREWPLKGERVLVRELTVPFGAAGPGNGP